MSLREKFILLVVVLLVLPVSSKGGEGLSSEGANLLFGESLGDVRMDEFLLEPFFAINDSREAKFDLSNTFISFNWGLFKEKKEMSWSGHLTLGQKELRGVPAYYGKTTFSSDEIGVVEGYGQLDSYWGQFRVGLIPLEFGLTGGGFQGEGLESELLLQRPLLFQLRLIGLRDIGAYYSIVHNGFFTSLSAHNGESGVELDERIWYTANWGWGRRWSRSSWKIGFSGMTGKTTAISTAQINNNSSLTVFDPTSDALWRMGLFYIKYKEDHWGVQAEYYSAKVDQPTAENSFSGGHVDVFYQLSSNWDSIVRYDVLDPNENKTSDHHQALSTAVIWNSDNRTSRLFFEYVHNFETQSQTKDNRFLIRWRLASRP